MTKDWNIPNNEQRITTTKTILKNHVISRINQFGIKNRSSVQPKMNYSTENSLFVELQNENALEKLWLYFYDKSASLISGFTRKKGVPQEDVCDVLQETLLELYAALPRFQYDPEKGKFRNFLLLITSRELTTFLS